MQDTMTHTLAYLYQAVENPDALLLEPPTNTDTSYAHACIHTRMHPWAILIQTLANRHSDLLGLRPWTKNRFLRIHHDLSRYRAVVSKGDYGYYKTELEAVGVSWSHMTQRQKRVAIEMGCKNPIIMNFKEDLFCEVPDECEDENDVFIYATVHIIYNQ